MKWGGIPLVAKELRHPYCCSSTERWANRARRNALMSGRDLRPYALLPPALRGSETGCVASESTICLTPSFLTILALSHAISSTPSASSRSR